MLDDTGPRPAQDQATTIPGAAFSASGRARDSAGVLPYRPHSGVYPGINPVPGNFPVPGRAEASYSASNAVPGWGAVVTPNI